MEGSNALMLAAGGGNTPFFKWFYERAQRFAEGGSPWDSSMRQPKSNAEIARKGADLAREKY